MRVCLCALRLEISDSECDELKHLRYSCFPEKTEDTDKQGKKALTREEIQKNQGQRKTRKITIESYEMAEAERKESAVQRAGSLPPSGGEKRRGRKGKELRRCGDSLDQQALESDRPPPSDDALDDTMSVSLPFRSGNPFVEVTEGILHFYKEKKNTDTATEKTTLSSEMLCMLRVPALITSRDLLSFIAPCAPDIQHVRIIRDSTPDEYMVLLKFRSTSAAEEFYITYNGLPFTSLEEDTCNLVCVSRVETIKESEGGSLPLEGHTELPVCPVCLERMDESVDGILTILCNHSFHGSCLSKWGDTSCPVCRYSSTPEREEENRCSICQATGEVWICLICGHLGCGRYEGGHAHDHFMQTQHTYAMQVGSNRVWDYVGDNFVHRLVQNKTDGKLVELDGQDRDGQDTKTVDGMSLGMEEKMDSVRLEFTYLLTSQLEKQRQYFEAKIAKVEHQAHEEIQELKERAKKLDSECKMLKDQLELVTKEKGAAERKVNNLTGRLTRMEGELKEEREMNKCLRENQSGWQEKLRVTQSAADKKAQEVVELEEQLRDLMLHLEGAEKLKAMDASKEGELRQEIQEGRIVLGSTPSKGARKKRTR